MSRPSRVAVCLLALSVLAPRLSAEESGDLQSSHPAFAAVQKALAAGVMCLAEGKFDGAKPLSRYDTAWFLGRTLALAGVPEPPAADASPFTDVAPDHWAYKEIRRSVEAQILQGYDGKFSGERSINRYQLALILQKLFEKLGVTPEGGQTAVVFADLPANHWAFEAVKACTAQGVLWAFDDGDYEGFHGQKLVTRFHMARVAGRVLDRIRWTPDLSRIVKAPGTGKALGLKEVEAGAIELADELALLNVKTTSLEEAVAKRRDNPTGAPSLESLREQQAVIARQCASLETQVTGYREAIRRLKSAAPLSQAGRNLESLVTEFADEVTFLKEKLGKLKEALGK